jgi:signal peptidase I
VAGLLALICPGLGLVYVGRPRTAVCLSLATGQVFPLLVLIGAFHIGAFHVRFLFGLTLVGIGFYVGAWIVQFAWSIGRAARSGERYVLARFNQPAVYVAYFAIAMLASFGSSTLVRRFAVEPFKIPSNAMVPTIFQGDQVYAVKVGQANRRERGDLIVFKNPVNPSVDFIKRIIGVPGDRVRIANHRVIINGVAQPRREIDAEYGYVNENEGGRAETLGGILLEETLDGRQHGVLESPTACDENGAFCNFPDTSGRSSQDLVVPHDTYFVMGDNRDRSADSRFGLGTSIAPKLVFVPEANVKGTAAVIWLSFTLHDGVRWSRMGMLL